VTWETYQEIWAVDFEFVANEGQRPDPVCLVAKELRTGRTIRQWRDELSTVPPYSIGPDSLFVAYYASAELGCHLALGWPIPARILDLYVEFRNAFNGLTLPAGRGLIGALTVFGLDHMPAARKNSMRDLVIAGGPWTAGQRLSILDYCESDVLALEQLLPRMLDRIDLPRALLRGRYMAAAARMEWNGVPIDTGALAQLRDRWDDIKYQLISEIDRAYGVFDGTVFKADRFEAFLIREGIAWPRLESGALDLSDETFREMAKAHATIAPLRELRSALSQMRLAALQVGPDGRNRALLSAFAARSGRNAPSNAKFIFGPAVWLRSLIRPEPGMALAYIDWQAQEHGIAAALSGDGRLIEAYLSGDPYLAFAKQAGAVPPDGTKASHARERGLYKTVVLGVGYGMEAPSLAARTGISLIEARELLLKHREAYPRFWAWSQAAVDRATLLGSIRTVFGWQIRAGYDANPRSLRNFPMQANGAEMLRIACCLGTERGIRIAAPVHDALLIEAPQDRIEADAARMQDAMREASRAVLAGFELRTDVEIICHPDRYSDPRGEVMWKWTRSLIEEGGGCRRLSS
jgi:hypothetical protein